MADQIAQLLADSTKAHKLALSLRHKLGKAHPDAIAALTTARDARAEAHRLDPDHLDPAWTQEQATLGRPVHGALMAFYAKMFEVPA